MRYCSNCGKQVSDYAKYCEYCGAHLGQEKASTERQEFKGKVYKCPNCGEALYSFAMNCPSCGYEIRGAETSASVKKLATQLENAKTGTDKAFIIKHFPIPNTKEDIWEFLILASSNAELTEDNEIIVAWQTKLLQVLQKAKLVFKDSDELISIEKEYRHINKELNKKRQRQKAQKTRAAITELTPVFPQYIIVFGWITSILILLTICQGVNPVDATDYFAILSLILMSGAIFIPFVLRTNVPLPKIVVTLGIVFSIILLISLCKKSDDFNAILTLELICVIIIFARMFRYDKKTEVRCASINKASLILASVSLVTWLIIYGIGSLFASEKIENISYEIPTISLDSTTNEDEGIYTYEIRNYIGKNVAAIGTMYGNQLIDEYGEGRVKIVFVTEDGMLISNDDEKTKKQYTVVNQNVPVGTKITVVHQRNDRGKPEKYLVDYLSIEEILLYVAPIGTTSYNPEFSSILPTLDRHILHIRDYKGRNAASFGDYYGSDRVDEYNEAKLKLSFTAEDGTFVDASNINELKKYIIVGQDISPNTELKLVFDKDRRGIEEFYLIQSQNYQEINLIVKPIDSAVVKQMPKL